MMVWSCHEEDCNEDCNEVKDEGKETKRKTNTRWLDNMDSHLKGKNTSQKDVLETKCLEDIDFSIN